MRNYTLTLRAEGPVFIGDGQKIGKKEYIFDPIPNLVHVPDMSKMFRIFQKQGLMDAYQDYLLNDRRDFVQWLRNNRLLLPRQIPSWVAYSVDSADAVFEERGKREILTFIKDPYGCPYVPGSSVKGMLRTVLLSAMILQDRENLRNEARAVRQANLRESKTRLLSRETDRIEQQYLRTLNRPDTKPSNAVNDIMSGLRISDSRPLSTENLILCQKIDVTTDGQRKRLPIFRECLRPGTEITFNLTVLPDEFPHPAEELLQMAERCRKAYDRCFHSAFPTRDIQQGGTVYLGGGCGYATKTFAYPLLGENGVETVSRIINATISQKDRPLHKHHLDRQKGVSPHILKCTQYRGQVYEMGACSIAIEETF